MLALGSSEATAQSMGALNVPAVVRSIDVDAAAKPLGVTNKVMPSITAQRQAVPAVQTGQTVTIQLPPTIDREAAWLYKSGWPLYALADKYGASATLGDEANCLATAVYFEARGESPEGQLAVARVVMNRATSGRYPASWCAVVKQPAQFSFVNHGQFPSVDTASVAWHRAEGIARLAQANVVPSLSNDVLWYHANYVAPSWRRNLREVEQIGAHIFYRA